MSGVRGKREWVASIFAGVMTLHEDPGYRPPAGRSHGLHVEARYPGGEQLTQRSAASVERQLTDDQALALAGQHAGAKVRHPRALPTPVVAPWWAPTSAKRVRTSAWPALSSPIATNPSLNV